MGEEVLSALSPSQQVVKIVHEELIKILGSHSPSFASPTSRPASFLIVGLQGSGKTTSTGKLARWLSKNGHTPDDGVGGRLPSGGARAARVVARERQACRSTKVRRRKRKPLELARSARREAMQDRPRRAAGGHRRPSAHRRRADGRAPAAQGAAQPGRDPVRRRRHDRAGRGQIGRRVPQAPRHHRRHPDQDGRRCARRRGALDPPRDRPAAQVRRRGREVRRARAVPSRPRRRPHSRHGRRAVASSRRSRRPSTRSRPSRCSAS